MRIVRVTRAQALLIILFVFLPILFLYKFVTRTSLQATDERLLLAATTAVDDHKSIPATLVESTANVRYSNADETTSKVSTTALSSNQSRPNYCLHAFYYMWYANEVVDGAYKHWNHRYIPHWDPKIDKRYIHGYHKPPDDIGASFYPQLGCYSSGSASIIRSHMQMLVRANVGVIAVSWYPPEQHDDDGLSPDSLLPLLLDIAHDYAIKVAIHSEPYKERSPLNFKNDLKYIISRYNNHPALFKIQSPKSKSLLPLVYLYDSYHFPARDWAEIFSKDSLQTIRGTPLDCVAISLLVDNNHKRLVLEGQFDGFYTYFASDGFSYGSRTRVWPSLAAFADQNNLVFIPSAGPGYDDTQVRAWNQRNSKSRNGGSYYKHMMGSAIASNGGIISITSFNEWHEGTQIEPAIPKQTNNYQYLDYLPHTSHYYLDLTAHYSSLQKCSIT